MFNDKDRCRACHAKKIIRENKVLDVHIEKGMKHGQKIVFRGEGDQTVSAAVTTYNSLLLNPLFFVYG